MNWSVQVSSYDCPIGPGQAGVYINLPINYTECIKNYWGNQKHTTTKPRAYAVAAGIYDTHKNLYKNLLHTVLWIHAHDMHINSLWPSDAIWWHRSGLTLAQIMACCLMAPKTIVPVRVWGTVGIVATDINMASSNHIIDVTTVLNS